jgi:hypothetical protein
MAKKSSVGGGARARHASERSPAWMPMGSASAPNVRGPDRRREPPTKIVGGDMRNVAVLVLIMLLQPAVALHGVWLYAAAVAAAGCWCAGYLMYRHHPHAR